MATASAAFTFDGAAGSLLKLSTTASATVTATIDSLDGVSTIAWSVASTDESMAPGDYTLTTSGPKGSVVTLTSDAAGTAGILQCRINGGINPQTGAAEAAYTKRAKWHVPTAGGLEVGCIDEAFESDPVYGTTGLINAAVRSVGGGSGVTSVSGTAPIVSSGGATPAISISAASGGAAGSMSAAHYALVDGATSAATASTLAKRDAAGRFQAVAGVAADDVAIVSQLGGGAPSRLVALDANDIIEWNLDETSAPWVDSISGVNLVGYDNGNPSFTPLISYGGSIFGARAPHTNWHLDTGLESAATIVGENDYGTVHGWVRFTYNRSGLIFQKNDSGSGPYIYMPSFIDSTLGAEVYAGIGNSGDIDMLPTPAKSRYRGLITVGQWIHFAMTWGGGEAFVYINGVLLPTTITYSSLGWNGGKWRLGKSGLGNVDAHFSKWRVCNVARTAAYIDEVQRRATGRWP